MRIALVCGYDWATPGGVQSQLAGLSAELRRLGDEVAVVSPCRGGATGLRSDDTPPLQAGRPFSFPVNGSVAPIAPSPAAFLATFRHLRRFAPDVVHVHEPMLPGPPLAALLFGPGPKVVTFHRAGADAIYKAAGKALGPIVSSRTAAATVVSLAALETARDALGGFMPRAVEIPNGVDTRRYSAAAARHARAVASGERYRSGRTPTVAFVGRHERRKGLSVLIEALPLLPPQLEVVIAGSGAETDGGRRRTADDGRVHFVGRLDDMALASLLARADIVVAPALSGESFGLVLLEAMAAGAVVVASSIHGYAAAAGDAALLVPPAQPGALAEAVTKLIDDDARRAEMAARGLARAEEFSLARVAHRYREVYEVVISS